MNKLLQLIALAIAAIAGYRQAIPSLRAQIEAKDQEIADLRSQVARDEEDDAALEERATKAENERAELQKQLDQADEASQRLAEALNDEPAVVSVHPDTFEVTAPPSASLADLSFRDREAETQGQVAQQPAVPADQSSSSSSSSSSEAGDQNTSGQNR